MKTFPWKLAQAGLLASLLILALGQAEAAPSALGSVRAVSVQGTVTVINDATQQSTPVTEGEVITQGLSVQTDAGASVTLLFSTGSGVVISQNSRLDISTFLQDPFSGSLANLTEEPTTSTTKLKLAYGELTASVKKLNVAGGSSFDVETPVGAAGVRGTTFRMTYNPHSHEMTVNMGKGTILLRMLDAHGRVLTQTRTVSAGKGITLTFKVSASGQVTVTFKDSTVPQAILDQISAAATSTANAIIATPPPPAGTFTTTTTSANGTTTTTKSGNGVTTSTITTPVNPTNVSPSQ